VELQEDVLDRTEDELNLLRIRRTRIVRIDLLRRRALGDYFPDYQGGDNYDAACDYLLHRFVSLNQSAATKQIYAHYTCATDTQQIKFVLSAIQDILLQLHLRECGLL